MCAFVLVAEDNEGQAEALRRYLDAEGHEVAVVHDGRSALTAARTRTPDLLVLDLMMPELNGLEVCRTLRRESDVMVLMLTARSSEDDMLQGLDLGADDYLSKPYSVRELLARVRTLLRRRRPAALTDSDVLPVGRLVVNLARQEVHLSHSQIDCTPGEFAILAAMAAKPDRVFSRAQLLNYTRGVDRNSTERTIDVHVMNLRRKIEQNSRHPTMLVTVYGVGYKLTDGTA